MIMKQKIFFMGLLLLLIQARAQRDSVTGGVIDVVKTFKPVLSEAIKIPVNPNPETPEINKPVFRYDLPAYQFAVAPSIYPIKPLSMGPALLPRLKSNYTKLGFGNYFTPLFEFNLATVRNKNIEAGIFYQHLSSSSGDLKDQEFSNNMVSGNIKWFPKNAVAGVEASYRRDMYHLYGYKEIRPSDSIRDRLYQTPDIHVFYQGIVKDSTHLRMTADGNYYQSSVRDITENNFKAAVNGQKWHEGIPFN